MICLRSDQDKVLDIYGNHDENGTKIILWTCHNGQPGPNQLWRFIPQKGEAGPSYDDFTGRDQNRHFIFQSTCGHGQCADVKGGSASNGASVVAWPKHGNANQQWIFEADGHIRSAIDEKFVLGVDEVKRGAFVEVQDRDHNRTHCQRWMVVHSSHNRDHVRLVLQESPDLCLDIFGGDNMDKGQRLALWVWNEPETPNQIWNIHHHQ